MFNAKSSTIDCPECGKRNRAAARFCVACAARLGAEPAIVSAPAELPTPAAPAQRGDSRFDAPRTTHSRPLPLQSAAIDTAGFWIKLGIGGLIVMIGFIGWSLYILTGSKAPAQMPVTAPVASTPASAAVSTAPIMPAAPAAPPPQAAPIASAPVPQVPAPLAARETATRGAAPQRQATYRERLRPPPTTEVRPGDFGGWVAPTRPPAMTSAPDYQDAGPPIVTGPRPSEPFAAAAPAAPAPDPRAAGGGDLGPPVVAGPGPRYDYSTPPKAAGR